MASVATFKVDHPDVGIEFGLARQSRFRIGRVDPFRRMRANPAPFAAGRLVRRTGDIERDAAVQSIDDDIDGAGFCRAAPAQDCIGAFDFRAPQVGGDPYVGA